MSWIAKIKVEINWILIKYTYIHTHIYTHIHIKNSWHLSSKNVVLILIYLKPNRNILSYHCLHKIYHSYFNNIDFKHLICINKCSCSLCMYMTLQSTCIDSTVTHLYDFQFTYNTLQHIGKFSLICQCNTYIFLPEFIDEQYSYHKHPCCLQTRTHHTSPLSYNS